MCGRADEDVSETNGERISVATSNNDINFSFSNRLTELIKNYQKIIFDIHQMII